MSAETIKPPKIVALTQQGRATDQETKDECFRLWIELGRSWVAVSRRTEIPESTLRNWGTVENWENRRLELAHSFLPGAKAETSFALRLTAHNASLVMQRMVFEAKEYGVALDEKQMKALAIAIDRGGYSPVGSRSPVDGHDPLSSATDELPDFDAMSVEQLREYEQRKKRKRTPKA